LIEGPDPRNVLEEKGMTPHARRIGSLQTDQATNSLRPPSNQFTLYRRVRSSRL